MISVLMVFFFTVSGFAAESPAAVEKKQSVQPAVPAATKALLLDGFEANDWATANAEGTSVKVSLVPGPIGKALKVDYDLKETKQWVSLIKDIAVSDHDEQAVQFNLKAAGKGKNTFEVKLIDEDGTNYGHKFAFQPSDKWERITIDLTDFSYWWGGNPKLNKVKQIGFAISADFGKDGSVTLDELKMVPSIKPHPKKIQSGIIDRCDSLEGWKVEKGSGSAAALISMAGMEQKAVGVEYTLGTGHWAQLHKNFLLKLSESSVVRFFMKWTGEKNILEFKLVDKDGSNFGKKFEFQKGAEWQEIKIPLSEFTYWWGGEDKELDVKNIVDIWMAISSVRGGKGTIAIDNLEIVP